MRHSVLLNSVPFVKPVFHLPKGTLLCGAFQYPGGGYMAGQVKGDVNVEGKLVIGKTAEIRGDVYAKALEIMGHVYGNIFCTGKAILYNTAYIKGAITATILEIKEGALVDGVIIKKDGPDAARPVDAIVEEAPVEIEEPEPVVEPVPEKSTDFDKDATKWF